MHSELQTDQTQPNPPPPPPKSKGLAADVVMSGANLRRWSLRMAKAMAEKFADESARYRRRPHLETFSAPDPRYNSALSL